MKIIWKYIVDILPQISNVTQSDVEVHSGVKWNVSSYVRMCKNFLSYRRMWNEMYL